jgi:hypothetical protein
MVFIRHNASKPAFWEAITEAIFSFRRRHFGCAWTFPAIFLKRSRPGVGGGRGHRAASFTFVCQTPGILRPAAGFRRGRSGLWQTKKTFLLDAAAGGPECSRWNALVCQRLPEGGCQEEEEAAPPMEPNTQPPGAPDRLSPWLSRLDEMETSDQARYREVWLHEARVGWLSSALAREIGCPGPDCLRAFRAGRFHDVGKLETPDAILFKNGRLSSDEQREMRRHTTWHGDPDAWRHSCAEVYAACHRLPP